VIRLDNISKQHGHRILFIEASMELHKGEKVGLVGASSTRSRMSSRPPPVRASGMKSRSAA
jgi:hypothetical protein